MADYGFRDPFQNDGGIDTLRYNRKNSIPRQIPTNNNIYALRCLESPLGANQIESIRESGSLEYSDNTGRSIIVSDDCESHILESSIETERRRCEIHDRFIGLLPTGSEKEGNKNKEGGNANITLGKEVQACPNTGTIKTMQASYGELFRIGSLGGDGWKTIVPQKTCRLVHADCQFTSRESTTGNQTTMSQMQLCEGKSRRTWRCNDSPILIEAFKDNSRIATVIDYKVLECDPKELTYHIRCVAEFGFDHIIMIGKIDYGMIFLDCYNRVFMWENMSQSLWPLGDSPEEASKDIVKGADELSWFVKNGTVYEQVTKWEDL